jgi:hypothetical protein
MSSQRRDDTQAVAWANNHIALTKITHNAHRTRIRNSTCSDEDQVRALHQAVDLLPALLRCLPTIVRDSAYG